MKKVWDGSGTGIPSDPGGKEGMGGERNRNQEFVFRFRQCRYRISGRKKPENLIFFLSIFIQKVKVTPLNQFRELQISGFFPARYPVPALPEPEYKFLFPVPLTPYCSIKSAFCNFKIESHKTNFQCLVDCHTQLISFHDLPFAKKIDSMELLFN